MRQSGWQARLLAWAAQRLGEPFIWGESDCAMICLEGLDVLRGGSWIVDRGSTHNPQPTTHASQFRGRWASERAAARFQKKRGLDLKRYLESAGCFNWTGDALTGDFVLHPAGPFWAGHVCFDHLVVSSRPDRGVCYGRLEDALAMPGAVVMRAA